jgi:outer membrane receptor protein involved in Fe transport
MPLNNVGKPMLCSAFLIANIGWSLPVAALAEEQTAVGTQPELSLEEIVVTATKRSERLSDVPMSISVLGTAFLENQKAVRMEDYFVQVPGVQLNPATSGRLTISMRGITTGGSTNPTVGVTIDDVPVGSSSSLTYAGLMAADIDPATLERIEVLRGPQGTLYGAASLGGLLRYVTVRPKMNEFSGRYEVDGSTVNEGGDGYGVRGSANVPMVEDKLAATVSGFFRHDPGVVDDPGHGRSDVDSADVWGARISTLWQATENTTLRLSATYQSTQGDGSSAVLSTSSREPTAGLTQNFVAGSGPYERKIQQYDATLNIGLGWADLTAISGYGIGKLTDVTDISSTFGALTEIATGRDDLGTVSVLPSETKKFSQEVRLASPGGAQLEWLVGLFYTDEDADTQYNVFGTDLVTGAHVASIFPDAFPSTFEERAVFGSATYHFTDKFDVQIGGRASKNKQTYEETITGPFYDPPYYVQADSEDDSFTYLFSPRYRFSPSAMIYGRIATGYRPGGPNPGAGFGTPAQYDADTTTSYELGMKSDFLDRRVSVDASVYYIDWQDIQLQQIDLATNFVYYTNAGKARSQGVDLSVQAVPIRGMTALGTLAYGDADLETATNGGIVGKPGDRLPYSAQLTASLSLDQEFPVGAYTGFVGGTAAYLGERLANFSSSATAPRPVLPAFTTIDLRAGIRNAGWKLSVYAKNLTDERGILSGRTQVATGATGLYALTVARPRTIGLAVAKEF